VLRQSEEDAVVLVGLADVKGFGRLHDFRVLVHLAFTEHDRLREVGRGFGFPGDWLAFLIELRGAGREFP
jgi:hypothetical protein